MEQSRFQSWCARAPWAMFGLAPFVLLMAAYAVACLILWSGWKMFLPGADTPFVPIDGFAIVYFQAGRLLYFTAPILIGWTIAIHRRASKIESLLAHRRLDPDRIDRRYGPGPHQPSSRFPAEPDTSASASTLELPVRPSLTACFMPW